uniref:Uncharacterized protein n=1 Tax=Aegilops tauschii subsp. strangulata TaxID=200361 RepID=A0A453IKB7_AEGTS
MKKKGKSQHITQSCDLVPEENYKSRVKVYDQINFSREIGARGYNLLLDQRPHPSISHVDDFAAGNHDVQGCISLIDQPYVAGRIFSLDF